MNQERKAKGLYWDKAWKLTEGCSKVSPGCDNCWSEAETALRADHPNDMVACRAFDVLALDGKHFNGRVTMREDNLDLPLRIKKPTVFAIWNDLFHKGVTDDFIEEAYTIMLECRQHVFLVLTKRADRLSERFRIGECPGVPYANGIILNQWPEHIWHGVTVEDQRRADERIPHLLRVPGQRFLSIEPMLGPVDLNQNWNNGYSYNGMINVVLLGGESGKNARPMHTDWARSVRDQCAVVGVPFFFKQWGEWFPAQNLDDLLKPPTRKVATHRWSDSWGDYSSRVGKRASGRIFDGQIHDKLPWD